MDAKRIHYIKIMKEKRDLKRKIQEEFVDSGDARKMIDKINEKRKPSISIDDLPF